MCANSSNNLHADVSNTAGNVHCHVRIQRGWEQGVRTTTPPPPPKNHKNIGFHANTGRDPLKNLKIRILAIIGTPAKRRWFADDCRLYWYLNK